MSNDIGVNLYLSWFYLRGAEMPLIYDDKFYNILSQKFGASVNDYDYESFGDDDDGNSCSGFNQCESVFDNLNESMISKLEKLMDEPKIHGDSEKHFVLIPLCSFGDQTLKDCFLFKPSKLRFLDNVCYTFDANQIASIEPKFGLNLVLNINNLPQIEKPTLKMFVHEPGTSPDVYSIESSYEEINDFPLTTKVGIRLVDQELSTENFDEMSFEKRNCLLKGEKENYTRIDCLVNLIHEFATKQCNCKPRLLKLSLDYPFCNMNGSKCFREAIIQGEKEIDETNCPYMCESKKYKLSRFKSNRNSFFDFGGNFIDFMNHNPTNIMLNGFSSVLELPGTIDDVDYSAYIKASSNGYSLIQIFFDYTQPATIITKDAKVTLADMVSNIGGTIGIFLGLSTISILDLIMDCIKNVKKHFCK